MRKKNLRKQSKKLFLLCFLILHTAVFQGCSNNDSNNEKITSSQAEALEENNETALVLSVNQNNIFMDKMLYYITYYESLGAYQAEYNEYYYGITDYWDSTDENGITMRESLKNSTMDTAIRFEILADQAMKVGISLSEDETKENQSNAENFLSQLTQEQKEKSGITTSGIKKALDTISLGMKYSEKIKENLVIDEATITNSINKEEYQECETEYLYLPTVTYDADLKPIEPSEEEKLQQLEFMEQALKKANSGMEFSKIKTEMADVVSLTNTTRDFIQGSEAIESAYQEASMALKNGEISDIIKGEYGYYIIKMINNSSTKSYDAAIEEALLKATNEAYLKAYEELKKEYTITTNTEYWDSLRMGEITLLPTEDEESPNEATDATDTSQK